MARHDLWPTPTKSDGTGGPGHSGRQGGKNLRTAVSEEQKEMWPTPTARLGNRRAPQAKRYKNTDRSYDLDDAVAWHAEQEDDLLPTPRARDWKDRGENTNYSGMIKEKGQLAGAVGGSLNPTFVEVLMGFPVGWTELD
jgi:hypothetical protein